MAVTEILATAANHQVSAVHHVLLLLGSLVMIRILVHLRAYAAGRGGLLRPESWKLVQLAGIPKEAGAERLDDQRWIALVSTLLKWFLRIPVSFLQSPQRVAQRPVATVGFTRHQSTAIVVASVRWAFTMAWSWGRPLVVVSLDIYKLFDNIDRRLVHECEAR